MRSSNPGQQNLLSDAYKDALTTTAKSKPNTRPFSWTPCEFLTTFSMFTRAYTAAVTGMPAEACYLKGRNSRSNTV